jgi:hypothetical protein
MGGGEARAKRAEGKIKGLISTFSQVVGLPNVLGSHCANQRMRRYPERSNSLVCAKN